MSVRSVYGAQGSENGVRILDGDAKAAGVRPLVVWVHGRGVGGVTARTNNGFLLRPIAEAGYLVVANDIGGTTTWGAEWQKVTDAVSCGQTTLGASAGQVALICSSMGALSGLRYARANPAQVACIALMVPVTDLAYQHDPSPNGWASEIEAAYIAAGTSYAAAVADMDPMQNTAGHAAGPPLAIWRATDDAVAITERQDAFADATGAKVHSLGAVGHAFGTVDAAEVIAFLRRYL